ncbi:MAG: CoA-binding protein [Candidatus Kariarchaeaceae archaeon]|jgi:signal transduction histidine kinase/predicted CoA-binding protein
MTRETTLEFLRKVPLFAGLEKIDLDQLCGMTHEETYEKGEIIMNERDESNIAYVIKHGQLEILKNTYGKLILVAVRGVGDLIGELSLFQDLPRSATVRARSKTTLISVTKEVMDELFNKSPNAVKSMFQTILTRWRSTETLLKQNDKMAQLGTLSAGLAHELNNPSAAIARGAASLQVLLDELLELQFEIDRMDLTITHIDLFKDLKDRAKTVASEPPTFDALERSDLEYEMEQILEGLEIENPWDYSSALVNLKFSEKEIQELVVKLKPEEFPIIIKWVDKSYAVFQLQTEVTSGAERVSAIVKALKEYSFLDQAPLQSVNIHKGIDNTLLILQNKLKYGITVKRAYGNNIPVIQAYGSELNQVWTNIIDNACDALAGKAKSNEAVLTIKTSHHNNWVLIEFEDNGPGIPKDLQEKIFNPFFTTKPPGKGTGLGLDISYNIIVEKHHGNIKVYSKQGKTCFKVFLPVDINDVSDINPLEDFIVPDDEKLINILENHKKIAVVYARPNSDSPAYTIPRYLSEKGYQIYAVNPKLENFLGKTAYANLNDIQDPIDIVLIFRQSQFVYEIVEEAIEIKSKVIWMQEGIINEDAALLALEEGIDVVMDRCMRATHNRLSKS